MKIYLDTNIWLRHLVEDTPQSKSCTQLLNLIDTGGIRTYTSTIVLLEIYYVLTSIYQIPKKQVIKDLKDIAQTRNLTVIDQNNHKKALKFLKQTNIKFTDCLIATQLPENTTLITYDKDFNKIPQIKTNTPAQLLRGITPK